jgi:hypothetical protein
MTPNLEIIAALAGVRRIRVSDMESRLQLLQIKIKPLEIFVHLFANALGNPTLHHSASLGRGFRYPNPDVRHFCLLKAVRAISGFNAAIVLAREGYTQEIAVIIRTIIECATHIEYVMTANESDAEGKKKIEKYVQDFFDDFERGDPNVIRRAQVPQRLVHETIAADLDRVIQQMDRREKYRDVNTVKLLWNVYRIFSNYVHSKYPEVMDLFGGTPGKFHLCGMLGTSKDAENLEILETYIITISNTIRLMILQLDLRDIVQREPLLAKWYARK